MFKRSNKNKGKKSTTKNLEQAADIVSTKKNQSSKLRAKIEPADKEIENSALKKILDHLQNDLKD